MSALRLPWRSASPTLSDLQRDVRDEIEAHLALAAADLERQGLAPENARVEALRRFGDPERIARDLVRAGRREGPMAARSHGLRRQRA